MYRTPGGHRRFSHQDLLQLTANNATVTASDPKDRTEGSALRRIRRRLSHEEVTSQPWYQSVEEEGRDRMRLFGRRLLSVLMQEPPARRQRQEALAESLMLGREYGTEMADRGVALQDTVEALLFFRGIVLDTANPRQWSQVLELADRVLVGVIEGHSRRSAVG